MYEGQNRSKAKVGYVKLINWHIQCMCVLDMLDNYIVIYLPRLKRHPQTFYLKLIPFQCKKRVITFPWKKIVSRSVKA